MKIGLVCGGPTAGDFAAATNVKVAMSIQWPPGGLLSTHAGGIGVALRNFDLVTLTKTQLPKTGG